MKKLICLLLVLSIAIPFANAQLIEDTWMTAIGHLDMLLRRADYDNAYHEYIAQYATFWATWAAAGMRRAQAETRASDAVRELCNHDPSFCADVFKRYGLRWHD